MLDAASFRDIALSNPANRHLLEGLADLALPQGHLTAGCLFQTAWNVLSGRPPAENIKDYDVFYFDGSDLSWEAEDAVIRRVAPLAERLGLPVEVKNQARVHLWYRQRFGADYPQLHSARDGISRYLVRCTCVGIDAATGEVVAPDGFADLEAGILRINPLMPQPGKWQPKAESYRARWPWLKIVEEGDRQA
ncbi:MAG: nucleotidyltransferase family protein [Hyphomicrobiales bacterium]|uniref:nucleotidyltransferase family protein n=1 Tax=Aestuariivirga sp. TaxID=2650926 RepID=UPI0035AD8C10